MGVGAGMLKPLRDSLQPPRGKSSWVGDYVSHRYIKLITVLKHEGPIVWHDWHIESSCMKYLQKGSCVPCIPFKSVLDLSGFTSQHSHSQSALNKVKAENHRFSRAIPSILKPQVFVYLPAHATFLSVPQSKTLSPPGFLNEAQPRNMNS